MEYVEIGFFEDFLQQPTIYLKFSDAIYPQQPEKVMSDFFNFLENCIIYHKSYLDKKVRSLYGVESGFEDFLQQPTIFLKFTDVIYPPRPEIIPDFYALDEIYDKWFMCPIQPRPYEHMVLPDGYCTCTFNNVYLLNGQGDFYTLYNTDSFMRCIYAGRPWFVYEMEAKEYGFLPELVKIYSPESMSKMFKPFFKSTDPYYFKDYWHHVMMVEYKRSDALLLSKVPEGYYNWAAILYVMDTPHVPGVTEGTLEQKYFKYYGLRFR